MGRGVISVGVIGAAGRMGLEVCAAVRAEEDLTLASIVDTSFSGEVANAGLGDASGLNVSDSLEALKDAGVQVAVDFTQAESAVENIRWCIGNGIHVVVGTSGIPSDVILDFEVLCAQYDGHVLIAPNFAIGAVLAMKFAEMAAAWMPDAEIIELHHSGKLDSPSGTALNTVEGILRGRKTSPAARPGVMKENVPGARGAERGGVHVHSVRLPGLVASQEVLFGGPGQTLSIRHDSLDRKSFMPGVIHAVRQIDQHPGVTIGLESCLGL